MITGVSTTFSRWMTQWYPSELQEYRGLYILKESMNNKEETGEVLYTPCYQAAHPHEARHIFTCSQQTVLLRAFEDDQGSPVLFGEEQEARQYLDMRIAETDLCR